MNLSISFVLMTFVLVSAAPGQEPITSDTVRQRNQDTLLNLSVEESVSAVTRSPAFREIRAFLEFIKLPKEPNWDLDERETPYWDISRLDSCISKRGVEFSDENHILEGSFSHGTILREISARSGVMFSKFSHIARIYSEPRWQWADLGFENHGDTLFVVYVSHDWYKLSFLKEDGRLKLSRVHCLEIMGD